MRILLPHILLLIVAGCSRTPEPYEAVVARVGDRLITAEEFVLSYEFGFSHLKQGDNPRRAYLERMIDEKMLALEGYRLRLDTIGDVRRRLQSLREKLLVEAVFERDVNARVEVNEDELRHLMRRDRVRFKLRYLPAPTREAAFRMRSDIEIRGFEHVLSEFLESEYGSEYRAADFESPILRWFDISPILMEAIEDLALEEISEPLYFKGSYLLLQVKEVYREPVSPVEDPAEVERYRQIAFHREAKERTRSYIGEKMKPLDLRLKGRTFSRLRTHLWPVYKKEPASGDLIEIVRRAEGANGDSLKVMLEETLFTTRSETWTVSEFAVAYPLDRYPLSIKSEEAFSTSLYDAIGLLLRDRAFVKEAEFSGLDATTEFQIDYRRWADKWVFRAAGRHLSDSLPETLDSHMRKLRGRYEVEVFEEVLTTLDVGPARGPADPNIMLLERHSGQPAIPIVDPWWGRGKDAEGSW